MKEFIGHYDSDGEIIKFYVTANLPTYSKTTVQAPKENLDEEDEADLPKVYLSANDIQYDTSAIATPWLEISKEEHHNITSQPGKYIIHKDRLAEYSSRL
ncbi:hypothetical protein [Piscirickettsia salmonis]|uniref:hypothetical protein n=1 Tax=Piscirickettsia salmonis TaxID=1238 RepID=UPI0006BC8431|nr:hypothetical protein [Piscirickettsia salmonis]ALA26600.1 nitrogenase iron-molybdenum cofactor biosynthesis protein NifE [Piscirickettsia salmonis]APS49356.1 hypothetical protein AVI49_17010 [Piscirickettsia salmonis]QGO82441.1 hypothetical protein Psal107_03492 [Piscirickettsia salmonis]QGP24270.1 hypothetical protein Psal158_03444 [Piscirickettsia salmonis]QGP27652.1 hypothetical protein Psal159_03445 [Piscirickettsia salmonis]